MKKVNKWFVGSTIAAAAIASVLFFSTYSLGTTYYVRVGGSGSCGTATTDSPSTAVGTIAAGVGCTTAGNTDIVIVHGGTYNENINGNTLTIIKSGTSFANATNVRPATGETVTQNGGWGFSNSQGYFILGNTAGNWILEGTGQPGDGIYFSNGAHHILVESVEVRNWNQTNNNTAGIHIADPAGPGHQFKHVNVHHNGYNQYSHGLYNHVADVIIEDSSFHDNAGYGITIYSNATNRPDRTIVRRSTAYNNGTYAWGCGIGASTGDNIQVYNNMVWSTTGTQDCGIEVNWGGVTNTKVYNNSVTGGSQTGILVGGGSGADLRNNIAYGNSTNINVDSGASGTTYSKNLCNAVGSGTSAPCTNAGNPLFVSTTNLHIQTGSLAIDTATGTNPTGTFTTDFDNDSRPQPVGGNWDIGADEFLSGGTPNLTILTPDGTTNWQIGNPQTITWSCNGCGGPIDINIDRGNAGTFTESIVQDWPLVNGNSYGWTVTGPVDGNCKIRIRDNDGTPTATTANFNINASVTSTITVTEPKSGDLFLSGQNGPVRWTSTNISGTVKIELSRDGGSTWELAVNTNGVVLSGIGFNDGDEPIVYNAPTSSNCKVRITSNDGSNTTGTSSGTFRIGGTRAGFLLLP